MLTSSQIIAVFIMSRGYLSPRPSDLPFHAPSNPVLQSLPRAVSRTLKYILLLTIALGFLYTLSQFKAISRYLPVRLEGTFDLIHKDTQISNNNNKLAYAESSAAKDRNQNELQVPENPRIGKITASFGLPDPIYEAAISSHTVHNALHAYPHFVLREQMVRGLWSKHAYLLTVIGTELAKPKDERLKWLFWHDRDTILMNPNVPLEMFLPPEPEFGHVNLLVTSDKNGLNNGVFLVRINQWALKLLASALSIREYQSEVPLKYTEQSGMEETIKRVSLYPPTQQW